MIKKICFLAAFAAVCLSSAPVSAQFKLNTKAIGKAAGGVAGNITGDAAVAKLGPKVSAWMDSSNTIADANSPYSKRLSALTGKFASIEGMAFNYKVYESTEMNVIACADGSIRIYSAIMDTLTDNQLLGLIANQIGHVASKHTRDAMMKVATGDNAGKASADQLDKILSFSGDKLGSIINELMQVPYTPEQEEIADLYGYKLLKSNGEKVDGMISAYKKLNEMDNSALISDDSKEVPTAAAKYIAVHPKLILRAQKLELDAQKDGLIK